MTTATVPRPRTHASAAVAAMVAAAAVSGAQGQVFNYLSSPVDVSPGTLNSWVDLDVSAIVAAGATGVILQVVNTSNSNHPYGVRMNGSTDTWFLDGNTVRSSRQHFFMIGVDSSRIFEVYSGDTKIETWVVGYTMPGVRFFTNGVNKSLGTTGSWVDINISADTGADTAIGAIFVVKNTNSGEMQFGLRKNGSSDNRLGPLRHESATGGWVGVDAGEICEMQIEHTQIDAYLVGYITSGAVFFTNAINKSTGTTGSYVDTDITADIGTDDANGALLEFYSGTGTNEGDTAFRRNGATYNFYKLMMHEFTAVGADGADVFEQKISDATMDLYLVGYTLSVPTSAFNYLASPADVSPSTNNAWVDVDVSALVPAGATGVIVQAYNEGSVDRQFGVRKNGSTDTWMQGLTLQEDTAVYFLAGLDANRIFEVWKDHSVVVTYLVGYTTSGVTTFTNAVNKSLSSTGSYQDISIASDTGADTAIGAILIMRNTSATSYSYAVRKKGSTDDRYQSLRANMSTGIMIGLDASEAFQLKIANTAVDTYLMGYVTSGAVFLTNAVDKSISSTGAYTDIDITAQIGSNDANGAIVEWTTSDDRDLVATRTNGSSHDVYEFNSHVSSFNGIDSANLLEGKIENTGCDFFLVGYTVSSGPAMIASAANQIFLTGDPPTTISPITVTDGLPASITSVNDIRIRIPSGFNMTWDPSVTTATVGGAASAKVSTTVTYENSNRTLVLDVTSDFADGESLTVSDLRFANFTALSAADNLELDIDNDGSADAMDSQTIEVKVVTVTYRSIGTDSGILYQTGSAAITSGTNTITFSGGASLPASVGPGDRVIIGATTYHILTKDSDVQVTVQETASGDQSGAYTIRRAYTTLQAWETARQGNLSGLYRREVGVCYNDPTGPFNARLVIDGSTTSAGCHMMLTVAAGHRHNGVAGAGARLDLGGGIGIHPIEVVDPYSRIEWLEITNWLDDWSGVRFHESNSDNSSCSNLLLHNFFTGTSDAAIMLRANNVTVRNCVIYDGDSEGIRVRMGTGAVIENCTVYGIIGEGIRQISGTTNATFRNNISVGSTNQDFFLEGTISYFGYNMFSTTSGFDPNSYQGNNQSPPADLANLFVSIASGSENLHIKSSGHNALDTGLDLSASFTEDIDGQTRSAAWDLGADEYGAGGAGPSWRLVYWKEIQP